MLVRFDCRKCSGCQLFCILKHITICFFLLVFAEVMASVKLIPKPKEPLLLPKPGGDGCVRCAVVGNAGILNGSKMGKEIDAHDYVFR